MHAPAEENLSVQTIVTGRPWWEDALLIFRHTHVYAKRGKSHKRLISDIGEYSDFLQINVFGVKSSISSFRKIWTKLNLV